MKHLNDYIKESKGAPLSMRTADRFDDDVLIKKSEERKYKLKGFEGRIQSLLKQIAEKIGGIDYEQDCVDSYEICPKKELNHSIENYINHNCSSVKIHLYSDGKVIRAKYSRQAQQELKELINRL